MAGNKSTATSIGRMIKNLKSVDDLLKERVFMQGSILAAQTVNKLNEAAGIDSAKMGKVLFRWILDPEHSEAVCDEFNTCEVNANADIGLGVGVYSEDNLPEKIPPVHKNCSSSDTEVYTDVGWKYFYELRGYERIYALNPETLEADYIDYVDYIAYHYKGNMVRFSHKYMDFIVTPDHNMFILRRKRNWKKGESYGKFIGYNSQLITADAIGNNFKEYQFYKSQEYKGGKDYVELFGKKIDGKLFAKFMGYYLSEGSVTKRSDNYYQITISQHNNENKHIIYNDVVKLFKCSINKGCVYIQSNIDLAIYLYKFGKSYQKCIPQEIKDLNKDCLEAFISAYVLGDGNISNGSEYKDIDFSESRHLYTSSKQMADDFTEIFLKLGKSVSYTLIAQKGDKCVIRGKEYILNHDVWSINELKKQTYHSDSITKSYVPYDDMVYGVTVEKWHVILVRRKGKIMWSGNCKCELEAISPDNQDEVGWSFRVTDKGFVFTSKSEQIESQLSGTSPQVSGGVITATGTEPNDYVTPILREFHDNLTMKTEKIVEQLFSSLIE